MKESLRTKINVIITGTTGMVGEGVLLECLQNDAVAKILVINRRPQGKTHPKLKEIIHSDFYDLSPIEDRLAGYDACYFCLGVSSVGMKEQDYHRQTYELTMHVAATLARHNPDMTFCYVSGVGTDSSEKGKVMWARVKGKTENALLRLPFRDVYNFRPGFLEPTRGMQYTNKYYKYIAWLTPLLRKLTPNYICSLQQLGQAMISVSTKGYKNPMVEVKDIVALASMRE